MVVFFIGPKLALTIPDFALEDALDLDFVEEILEVEEWVVTPDIIGKKQDDEQMREQKGQKVGPRKFESKHKVTSHKLSHVFLCLDKFGKFGVNECGTMSLCYGIYFPSSHSHPCTKLNLLYHYERLKMLSCL